MNNTDQAWRDSALCAQVDPKIFFPGKGDATAAVIRVCQACPVRVQCLEFAMATEVTYRHGIWGGLTVTERHTLAQQRAQEPAA